MSFFGNQSQDQLTKYNSFNILGFFTASTCISHCLYAIHVFFKHGKPIIFDQRSQRLFFRDCDFIIKSNLDQNSTELLTKQVFLSMFPLIKSIERHFHSFPIIQKKKFKI